LTHKEKPDTKPEEEVFHAGGYTIMLCSWRAIYPAYPLSFPYPLSFSTLSVILSVSFLFVSVTIRGRLGAPDPNPVGAESSSRTVTTVAIDPNETITPQLFFL
jgi:hypothetical protein